MIYPFDSVNLEINPKINPLYVSLLRQGIGKYLISEDFNHLCIENNIDELWDVLKTNVRALNTYTVAYPKYTKYAEEAFRFFLSELSLAEKHIFIELLSKILINFSEWSSDNLDFSKIKQTLFDLEYLEEELAEMFSEINKIERKKSSFFIIQKQKIKSLLKKRKRKVKPKVKEKSWYKKPEYIVIAVMIILAIPAWDPYLSGIFNISNKHSSYEIPQPISTNVPKSTIFDNYSTSVQKPLEEAILVGRGSTEILFNGNLSISLISTSFEGAPFRHKVFATIGSPGNPNLKIEGEDVGYVAIYDGSEMFEIRITDTGATYAEFTAKKYIN